MRTSASPDARRREIGEAVWRVIRRDGIDAVSTRSVAAEAGMALGSLRHYFPRQEDVIASAMLLVTERTAARLRAIADAGEPDQQVLLEQFLPLDAERRAEMEVWLVLAAATLSNAALAPIKSAADAALGAAAMHAVDVLAPDASPGPARERAAQRLHAVIDGLAAHLVGPDPTVDAETARAIVAEELAGLARLADAPDRARIERTPTGPAPARPPKFMHPHDC